MQRLSTTQERFDARVIRGPSIDDCWGWTGQVIPNGYTMFWPDGRKGGKVYGHVFSFTFHGGSIPEGWEVDHLCHTRACGRTGAECPHRQCCNPLHLEAVSASINMRRSRGWTQDEDGQWFCFKGHKIREGTRGIPGCARCATTNVVRPEPYKPDPNKGMINQAIAEQRILNLARDHPLLETEIRVLGAQTVVRRLRAEWTYDINGWHSQRWGDIPFGVADPRTV